MKHGWFLSDIPNKTVGVGAYGILITTAASQLIEIHTLSVTTQGDDQEIYITHALINGIQQYFKGTIVTGEPYAFPHQDHIGSWLSPRTDRIRLFDGEELRVQGTAIGLPNLLKIDIRGLSNVYALPTISPISANQDYTSGLTNYHKIIGEIE